MTVRVGIIGVGGMGKAHVEAVLEHPEAQLVAACDTNRSVMEELVDRAPGVHLYDDFHTLLATEPLDVVCVILPHHLYPDGVCDALAKGMHVLKEKPLAKDLADALVMCRQARASGRQLFCGSQRKFTAAAVRTREIVRSGLLGRVYLAQAVIRYRWTPAWNNQWSWRGRRQLSGGVALVDSGWHALDVLASLMGTPSRVYASTGSMRPLPGDDYDVDLAGAVVLDYADGAMASVLATYTSLPGEFRVCLHGTQGDLEWTGNTLRVWTQGLLREVDQFDPDNKEKPIALQFAHFLEGLRQGRPGLSDWTTALEVQRTIEAAYRSAAAGQPVLLADVETL